MSGTRPSKQTLVVDRISAAAVRPPAQLGSGGTAGMELMGRWD